MPIQVTCQKCHKRFSVNEKFAGRTGPCPSCKTPIKIPDKNEEVVIHAPELGPKDSTGKAVLKPIEREEVKATPVAVVGIVAAILVSIIAAVALRFLYPQPADATAVEPAVLWWILAAGAAVIAGPIVLSGYWFLRNDELEPYRGGELALRVAICAVVYAALWGAYAIVKSKMFPNAPPEIFAIGIIAAAGLGIGALASLATLDFDFATGAIHFAFYLLVSVLFCFIIGVPAY